MANPTETDIRTTIGISNTTVLTSAKITLCITDSATITGTSDEIALRYYTCYLISKQWDTINATTSAEGVSFAPPNPQAFLDLYNERVSRLNKTSTNKGGMVKLSLNKDFIYDGDNYNIRPRREGETQS